MDVGESAAGADDEPLACVDAAGAATCASIRPAAQHEQMLVQQYWRTPFATPDVSVVSFRCPIHDVIFSRLHGRTIVVDQ